jgi:hypothetical protein
MFKIYFIDFPMLQRGCPDGPDVAFHTRRGFPLARAGSKSVRRRASPTTREPRYTRMRAPAT